MDATCTFCRIAARDIPANVIWEDKDHIAFLSHRPNTPGFSVVATKAHVGSYAFGCHPEVLHGLVAASATVGRLLDRALPSVGRTGLILEGFGVDHLHSKLVPMHGTRADVWEARHSERDEFFDEYQGFISSHDAAPADPASLAELAAHIRATEANAGPSPPRT